MTDLQQPAESTFASILARLERLCGPFPVLSSERRQDFEELLLSLLQYYRPRNPVGERLLRHLADEEWEIKRYRRHKLLLMERRFHGRLIYQAYREKAAQEHKAALAKKLAEQPPGQFILPEEALEGLIPEIDAMLLRPAEELDHARALEVGIVYFEHLDRLLNAAIVRRNAILDDMERYEHLFDPLLPVCAVIDQVHDSAVGTRVHAADDGRGSNAEETNAQGDDVAPPLAPSQEGQP